MLGQWGLLALVYNCFKVYSFALFIKTKEFIINESSTGLKTVGLH